MDTFTVTATELKNNTAEIMSRVLYGEKDAIVKKSGKPILRLTKINSRENVHAAREKVLQKYYGAIPTFPDAEELRKKFRKKFKMRI